MKKAFLVLLVIACLAATGWTGYLLFTDRIEPVVGAIILVVSIGVLTWNISVLRKYRVGAGTIISIFLIIALLGPTASAFAGVPPFSDAKDAAVEFFNSLRHTVGQPRIAYVQRIYASVKLGTDYGYIHAELIPADGARAEILYSVELWKKGYVVQTKLVRWSQSELDSRSTKFIEFVIPGEEAWTYVFGGVPIEDVYEVRVSE